MRKINLTLQTRMTTSCLGSSIVSFVFFIVFSFSWTASAHTHHDDFLQCLSLQFDDSNSFSKLIYTPNNSSYTSILQSSMQNLRLNTTSTPKPLVIFTPMNVSHIQATIACSRKHGMQVRIRSGGHDNEGLSYISDYVLPFVIVDLINLRMINVDVMDRTAWVQAGATLGEVYNRIAEKSSTLAFPAGACPTVGVGGHFSGGGYGGLMRKYGLAADNIIDAQLIDAQGRILDRKSMGEDLFWAIRGGGGNTFGVVVAWKLKLVAVPPTVTVFSVQRSLEQNATKLVHRWQYIANKLHQDLFIVAFATKVNSSQDGHPTIQVEFPTLFLGGVDRLLLLMKDSFPELGLVRGDCTEMNWREFLLYNSGYPANASLDLLLDRTPQAAVRFKGKSDYVKEPISETAFEGIWKRFFQQDIEDPRLVLVPYGGKMDEISESSTPFPHRAGNIYMIQYLVLWTEEGKEASQRHIDWSRRLYNYMAPYVSKNPREAYINYRDLDIGTNNPVGNTSYKQASIWGRKYFKNNFDKLVRIKTAVDPANIFRNEQSIPPFSA